MAYTVFEKTVAEQIIADLQERLDLYFGVEEKNTLGEVRVRNIGLYEKKTFKTLLEYYTEKMIYTKNDEYVLYGRKQITATEFRNITLQVSLQIKTWLRYYDLWKKQNPGVVVSDITGKRSKVLKYFVIIQTQWVNTKSIVQEELKKLKQQHRLYIIFGFTSSTEQAKIEEEHKEQLFISLLEFQKKLRENMLARIGEERKIDYDLLDKHIAWVSAIAEEDSSRPIRYEDASEQSRPSVVSHHQAWIDYLTLQVFGDRGYLFGLERENIPTAITIGNQPGLSDFKDFMYARAIAEAHRGEFGSEGDYRHAYSPSDVELVADLNKRAVDNILHRYQSILTDNDIVDPDDEFTGSAFSYKIPDEDILKRIEERILAASSEAVDKFGTRAKDEDVADYIREAGEEEARQYDTDPSFVDPYVDEGVNKYNDNAAAVERQNQKKITDTGSSSSGNNNATDSRAENTSTSNKTPRSQPKNTIKSRVTETINPDKSNSTIVSTASTGDDPDSASAPSATARTYAKANTGGKKKKYTFIKKPKVSGDVATQFMPTYRTFSGHDMVVTVQLPLSRTSYITKVIGAFQTVTYSIHNDKSPVRVLGNMNVKRYVFGPRTIAGSIHLTVFDRHWMRELLSTYKKIKSETERYFLADELPAFNIIISCANEYGHDAKLAIYGITIVNEGQVMSINDVYTENTYEFFATNVDYLDRVDQSVGTSKKTTSTLPIKGNTPKTNDVITYKVGGDDSSTNTGSSEEKSSDPTVGPETATNLDKYDTGGEREKYIASLKAVVNNTDKNDPASLKAAADKINELERKEIYRRTQLWLNKIYYPKLKELEENHAAGKISDEDYKQLRSTYIDSMVLNQKVIISGEAALADEYRNQLGVTYEQGKNTISELFPDDTEVEVFEPEGTTTTTPTTSTQVESVSTPVTKTTTSISAEDQKIIDDADAGKYYPVKIDQEKYKRLKKTYNSINFDAMPDSVKAVLAQYPALLHGRVSLTDRATAYKNIIAFGALLHAQGNLYHE